MLRSLFDEKVEFLIVGAYAMAAHGIPRATGDIDIWVRSTPENANKVYRALAKFGAPLENINPDDFASPDLIYQMGVIPMRIDILTRIGGVSFDQAYAERKVIEIDGISVPVLSRNCLLQNKKTVGRDKDLLDIKQLEKENQK